MGLPRDNLFLAVDRFGEDKAPRHVPAVEEMDKVLATETGEVRTLILALLHTAARRWLMARVCKRVGVRPFGFHAIRHLSASMMARAGIPLTTIQAILRHKSATTTAK